MSGRYLSDGHMDAARRRVESGQPPWPAAYAQLLASADASLSQQPLSIRDNGGSPFFRQDGAYLPGQDGVRDTAANHRSSHLAAKLSHACMDLALAHRFTGEAKYADKALLLIHAWCINQNTRMFPTGFVVDAWTPGGAYGGDIVLFHSMHNLFLAGYLLGDYPGWNLSARAGVRRWTKAMLDPQREVMFYEGREMYNNWEDARLLYLADGALLLDDCDLLLAVFDRWRRIIPMKMTDEGELHRETMRTRSMHYTLFALNSAVHVAEIARQHGVDLYGYHVNGRCLKKAVDYAAHYLLHMDEWTFRMIEPLAQDASAPRHLGLFEMAHARWGDRRYLDVINAWGGRPVAACHDTLLFGKE
jgi:hypothetical protein